MIGNKFLSILTNKIYSKPIQVHDDKESLKKTYIINSVPRIHIHFVLIQSIAFCQVINVYGLSFDLAHRGYKYMRACSNQLTN